MTKQDKKKLKQFHYVVCTEMIPELSKIYIWILIKYDNYVGICLEYVLELL